MGQIIGTSFSMPDLILCSPSQRTSETIAVIMEKANYDRELLSYEGELYLADTRTILYTLSQLDNQYRHVFVVAHNPGITDCLNQLTGELIDNVPTCGIAQIQLNTNTWQDSGHLTFYDIPKNHK